MAYRLFGMSTLLLVSLAGASPARGQAAACPDQVPQTAIAQMRDPDARAAALAMPRIGPEFIAQYGGVSLMISQLEAQIEVSDRWIAQETANQRDLGPGTTLGVSLADRQKAVQMMRDSQVLNRALLVILQCHADRTTSAQRGGAGAAAGGQASQAPGAGVSQRVNTAIDGVDRILSAVLPDDRPRTPTSAPVPPWLNMGPSFPRLDGPPAVAVDPSIGDGVGNTSRNALDAGIEDLLTDPSNPCGASLAFDSIRLEDGGRSASFRIVATQNADTPCLVTFALNVSAGVSRRSAVARTITVPPTGLSVTESVLLSEPVPSSPTSCAATDSLRATLIAQQDGLAAKFARFESMRSDTKKHRNELERADRGIWGDRFILGLDTTLKTIKLMVSQAFGPAVSEPLQGAERMAVCTAMEMTPMVMQTYNACTSEFSSAQCIPTATKQGAIWVEKTLSCVAREGSAVFALANLGVDAYRIAASASNVLEREAARTKTLDLMNDLDYALELLGTRAKRLLAEYSLASATLQKVEAACQSPLIVVSGEHVRSERLTP